jgi:hypothetical protein
MAKLSDLFGRKGEPGALVPRPRARGNGGGHISIENLSDIGSRMGEENEELRSLLTDTGRNIGELDHLKQAFDKLVAPFNATLRALATIRRSGWRKASDEARERQIKDLENARAALSERNNAMAKTLKTHETTLALAKEKGEDRLAHRAQRASGSRHAGVAHQYRKTRGRAQRRAATRAHGARVVEGALKPRARTIRGCKARWQLCARRCGRECRSYARRRRR